MRALSSGKVHPLVFHSGAFEMGTGTSDALVETPAVCCDHIAGIVQEHGWSQVTLSIKGTIVVWNWRRGSQVAVIVSTPPVRVLPIQITLTINIVVSDLGLHGSAVILPSSTRLTF